ncbi:DUF3048 domain-containing protein [Candidatus Microgenomates bacterium]|nr:MAG: DUF3048 domain-containing protein [Candidatus Microgenomates bacterium]
MKKNKIIAVILVIIVYVISTGASYSFFSQAGFSEKKSDSASADLKKSKSSEMMVFDETAPKTEACPLNGALYSKEQKIWWEKHRPLGIMIENHQEARPQSGLSHADVVYEAVAEGAITRFLAVFYCQDAGQVGPVRSARTYFLDFISEYGNFPLYTHVGGANTPGPADALSQIEDYEWGNYNDMNQFSIGYPTFWRDYDRLGHTVATEHTMYSTTKKLWEYAKTRGLTSVDKEGSSWDEKFVSYSFKDDVPSTATQKIGLEFWNNYKDYFVSWDYDNKDNSYRRNNGGAPHLDKDNNTQLSAKNVVVLYMQESNANDGYENNLHLLYKTKGTGKAVVFINGKEIKGTWRKDKRTSRTLIFDNAGNPIKFNRGLIWFEILPTDGVLKVS